MVWTRLDSIRPSLARLEHTWLGRVQRDSAGLGYARMGWNGLGLAGWARAWARVG